jgi:pectate lyase
MHEARISGTRRGRSAVAVLGAAAMAATALAACTRPPTDPGTTTTQPTTGPTTPTTAGPTTPTTSGPTTPTTAPPATNVADGWASTNGGTSGGAGGPTVTVSSLSALQQAVSTPGPRIVRVSGVISGSDMIRVQSNISILGNTGAGIKGAGFQVRAARNVIIRNLAFSDAKDDSINIEEASQNIWVDHNSFTNGYDGAVDVKRASDFVTISWNRTFNHGKTMLLGHSDDNGAQDRGHLRVSYHHNFFDGSGTRHPRTRFGNPVHVYNNYYRDNEYGVASTEGSGVLVEGNYFENVEEPTLVGYADSAPGTVVQRSNTFVGSGTPQAAGSVAAIPYRYTLEASSGIKARVTAGAGPGKVAV